MLTDAQIAEIRTIPSVVVRGRPCVALTVQGRDALLADRDELARRLEKVREMSIHIGQAKYLDVNRKMQYTKDSCMLCGGVWDHDTTEAHKEGCPAMQEGEI